MTPQDRLNIKEAFPWKDFFDYFFPTHEVTVSQYRGCVEDGRCAPPKDYKRYKYCNYAAAGRDNYPVNCLD
ncbi:MAG: hypothetical protein IIB73_07135 [Proteobacteria bacterium]|nr:hypothetical protein [Pseudomonadota bacterium]